MTMATMASPTLLDIALKVQSTVESATTQTAPARLTATTGRKPGNWGKSYKPTPPTMDEAFLILDALERKGQNPKLAKLGSRNRAIAAFIWRTGLRIHEALLVRPVDIDADNNQVHVVRGKGGKERWSVIDDYGLEELGRWMVVRDGLGFNATQPTFCVIEGPTAGVRCWDAAGIRRTLHALAEHVGIRYRVAPHQFRHAMTLEQVLEGIPEIIVSRNLGHADLGVTSQYLRGLPQSRILSAIRARPMPQISMVDALKNEGVQLKRPTSPDMMGALQAIAPTKELIAA